MILSQYFLGQVFRKISSVLLPSLDVKITHQTFQRQTATWLSVSLKTLQADPHWRLLKIYPYLLRLCIFKYSKLCCTSSPVKYCIPLCSEENKFVMPMNQLWEASVLRLFKYPDWHRAHISQRPSPASGFDRKGTVILQTPKSWPQDATDARVGCSKSVRSLAVSHGTEEGTFHSS